MKYNVETFCLGLLGESLACVCVCISSFFGSICSKRRRKNECDRYVTSHVCILNNPISYRWTPFTVLFHDSALFFWLLVCYCCLNMRKFRIFPNDEMFISRLKTAVAHI